ncbi:uncharacterized protein A1O5_06517 [Cladophialophora psammophila CBS 110553]|uniref:NACHT domain-containing protein n=1 Tax=Cladophialophora psammophila CBS 110553 TaxID=1182543 RepID=W9WRB0_9EURO|nr:uncharacterized protein A1O5_06517 [Cladophialophora psammophila CBS 110553]EXJ70448.1 hypothetical protein A1O5_06517 [Cladophialophora psammophila CBS 110553]
MTDPFSIAAGAAGFISLGLQVSQSLIDFYTAYKNQDADVDKTTRNLESLQATFRLLQTTLQTRTFSEAERAAVTNIESRLEKCLEIIQELEEESKKFKKATDLGIASKVRVAGRRLAYPFRKSTLQKLHEDIDEIRENVDVSLGVLQLRDHQIIHNSVRDVKMLIEVVRAGLISLEIRGWLRAPDASTNHNAIYTKRYLNTGAWFVEGPLFADWMTKPNSIIWLNGFAGCGKSILCATAIQHAFLHTRSDARKGIAFFYFTFDDESKQDESAMLRAVLLQLSGQVPEGSTDITELHTSYPDTTPPSRVLLEYLQRLIQRFTEVYLFIDALDESPPSGKRPHVLRSLRAIQGWNLPGLHLLVTSRDELDIRRALFGSQSPTAAEDAVKVVMNNEDIDRDIANYISGQLRDDPDMQDWLQHHDKIRQALTEKAGGVFRWVECQFQILRRCPRSEYRLEECLASLPRTLDETYERMLSTIDSDYVDDAKRILTLVCFSVRPLTVPELMDGIAVDLSGSGWLDRRRRLHSADDLRRICPGLLAFNAAESDFTGSPDADDEDDRFTVLTVHIAHFSVQEYIESERIRQQKASVYALQRSSANLDILRICLVCLLEPGLSSRRLDRSILEEHPLARFAASSWYAYYPYIASTTNNVQELVLKLFDHQKGSFSNWVRLHDLDTPWVNEVKFHIESEHIASPLYYSSMLGFDWIVRELIAAESDDVNREVLIHTLGGENGNALQAASLHGHTKVVETLLEAGADVNLRGGLHDNALQAASAGGHDAVIKLLLDKNADVNAHGGKYNNSLYAASLNGHENAVLMLLRHGADPNVRGGLFGHPLQAASSRGHETIVQILLENNADVNAGGGRFGNALQAAASAGHENVMKILLSKGADVNAYGGNYGSALQAASARGRTDIVQMLLKENAEVNAVAGFYHTALQAASAEGHHEIVKILLDSGADVTISGGEFGNALGAALQRGHKRVAELLQGVSTGEGPPPNHLDGVALLQSFRIDPRHEARPFRPSSAIASSLAPAKDSFHNLTAKDINQIILKAKSGSTTLVDSIGVNQSYLHDLGSRRHIFLIDDAKSMEKYWQDVKSVTHAMAYIIKQSRKPRMELCFMRSDRKYSSKTSTGLVKILDGAHLEGQSDINIRLQQIFKVGNSQPQHTLSEQVGRQPLNVYILTDGAWTSNIHADNSIWSITNALDKQNSSRGKVGLQFVLFGDDPKARSELNRLESGLALVR